jgi:DHA2 family multidrug resistance protein
MAEEKATLKQWIAVGGAVLGAFMAILDVSITNASLQNIQGALSASLDEGSWIATSYLIAEIIVIPLTGWFANIFSIRRYLLVNAALFLIFSMCCAWAWNLPSMIVFRALQGVTGGVLIPIAATIIITTLPNSQRPIGLALFGISATFAPCIGPTIGGWLTINYSWEYIFYLNIIPGLILMAAIAYSMDSKPMQLHLLKKGDWWGIATMAVGLGSLTYILEEGNRKDWFGSTEISYAAVACVIGFIFFFYIEFTRKEPFINLRLL